MINIPRSYYTYSSLLGLISALIAGQIIQYEFLLITSIGILFLCVFNHFLSFHLRNKRKDSKYFYLAIVFIVFFILGLFRAYFTIREKPEAHISHYLEQAISFKGHIIAEVDERDKKMKYILKIIELDNLTGKIRGKVLLEAPLYPVYRYGDILQISGYLKTPPEEEGFSYKQYLSRYEIYGIIQTNEILRVEERIPSVFLFTIYKSKSDFLSLINQKYAEPYASFLAGLLIGARKGMGTELTLIFQRVGLSHIIAVSGSNITMVIAVIMTMLSFLPRKIAFIISILSIIVFTIFVGMSAAVVRAAVMGVIGLVAIHTGKRNVPLISMLITIAVMGILQPKIYIADIGFQLSVFAVIGVIWIVPILPKFLRQLPEFMGIKEAVTLTIAATISVVPISIIHFKAFSVIAPLANLFVIPIIPIASLFGFLSLIPIPIVSDLLVFITSLCLKFSLFIAKSMSSIPYSYIENINLPYWIWGIYYLGLGYIFWGKGKKEED